MQWVIATCVKLVLLQASTKVHGSAGTVVVHGQTGHGRDVDAAWLLAGKVECRRVVGDAVSRHGAER